MSEVSTLNSSKVLSQNEFNNFASKDKALESNSCNSMGTAGGENQMGSADVGNGKSLQQKVFTQNTRHQNGGWKFIDETELKKQRGVCWELVKSVGNSIIEGKELTNTSLPIGLFEPRSFLEKLTDTWCYAPQYLPKAAATSDPVERLKLVVSFTVAGLHLTSTLSKPFNPLLGETFQAHFSDGTQVYSEQTSHHPPISNWEMIDANNTFHYHGYGVWSAACRGNVVKGYQKGTHTITFADGTTITWTLPEILIKGIFWGDRVTEFAGKIVFTDEKNKLGCEITFNPHALGFVRSIFSKQKEPSDYFCGHVYKLNATGNSNSNGKEKDKKKQSERLDSDNVCQVEGSWLTHLAFDNVNYWELKMVPQGVIYESDPLSTDSRYREDLRYLKEGNIEKAKEYKSLIEDKQRTEAKLRKEGKKELKEKEKEREKLKKSKN
ncbi:oxysterol binding family protein [Cavenderia fasciculata]|uniref:Oxysterol binding family protein n=1 Tax=Cavenderia fasciculata TaxID=261658 RepID=F4QDU2_CACFS|nr:oxysterol binding family protein [Cavenderia fasciculata]EGG13889.1 oxysterol binding family protein [Cavenderia fasciculata]|eukprot:XP_004350597.1 oxysterol binding family protein [Cavenderia fasciculata]